MRIAASLQSTKIIGNLNENFPPGVLLELNISQALTPVLGLIGLLPSSQQLFHIPGEKKKIVMMMKRIIMMILPISSLHRALALAMARFSVHHLDSMLILVQGKDLGETRGQKGLMVTVTNMTMRPDCKTLGRCRCEEWTVGQ